MTEQKKPKHVSLLLCRMTEQKKPKHPRILYVAPTERHFADLFSRQRVG
jgi:hypothetical protein